MKSVTDLLAAVRSVAPGHGKAAAQDPTKLPDPDEKGPVSKSKTEGSEEIDPPGPDKSPNDPVEPGDTPTGPKMESNGGEESPVKCAGQEAQEKARALLDKMAQEFGVKEATDCGTEPNEDTVTKAAPAARGGEEADGESEQNLAAAKTSTPEKAAAEEGAEKEASAKEAPIVGGAITHQIVQELIKTASGRQLIMESIDEYTGHQAATELLEKAAAESEAAEIEAIEKMAAEYELMEHYKAAAAVQAEMEAAYTELTKEASAEDLEKIDQTAELIKQASAQYEENPVAAESFAWGVKVAAAMMEAAPGEDAAAMEAGLDQAMPEPEGEPSIEEIIAALEELVMEGAIPPEQAEEILAMLSQAMGPAEGGEMPAEKQASINVAAARLGDIAQIVEAVTADEA